MWVRGVGVLWEVEGRWVRMVVERVVVGECRCMGSRRNNWVTEVRRSNCFGAVEVMMHFEDPCRPWLQRACTVLLGA